MIFLAAYWRWFLFAGLMVAAAGTGAIKMHAHDQVRYEALQGEYVGFKAKVTAEGRIAQEQANKATAKAISDKEKADVEHKTTVAALSTRIASLRHTAASTHSYSLPTAPTGSKRPDLACFDRTEFERATGTTLEGLRRLTDQGDEATLSLNTAKAWAQRR